MQISTLVALSSRRICIHRDKFIRLCSTNTREQFLQPSGATFYMTNDV